MAPALYHLSLRVRARRHGEVSHLQRLVGPVEARPLGGDGVLALEVVPAPAEPPVFEIDDRLPDQLVRAEAVIVIQLTGTTQQRSGGGGDGAVVTMTATFVSTIILISRISHH